MLDGTVKQVGPLTGTRVWTVPGRAGRPISMPRDSVHTLAPGEGTRLCAFCQARYLETMPEKARLVGSDFRELRRVPAAQLDETVADAGFRTDDFVERRSRQFSEQHADGEKNAEKYQRALR